MITFMVSVEVGVGGLELFASKPSTAFRAAIRISVGNRSWREITAFVMSRWIVMALVKYFIVRLASFAALRSSSFVTDLIVFQLGISTSLAFKIETGLYVKGIADVHSPNKPKHSMFFV